MNGPEHYRAAEQLLKDNRSDAGDFHGYATPDLLGAIAYAVLALVAATADAFDLGFSADERANAEQWQQVLDVLGQTPDTGPLVACNAAPADDGSERCVLPVGHDGMHETSGPITIKWFTSAPRYIPVEVPRIICMEDPGDPSYRHCHLMEGHGGAHEAIAVSGDPYELLAWNGKQSMATTL